jgi:hypothetical protein
MGGIPVLALKSEPDMDRIVPNLRRGLLALGMFSFVLLTPGCGKTGSDQAAAPASTAPNKAAQLRADMRKLWEDHITWTRLVIVSTAAGLPDIGPTTDRLLQNQTDIGNAIKPWYGAAAGDTLTALLRAHIVGAGNVLAAAKAGDNAKLDAAKTAWYANADQIAAFLTTANPDAWPAATMKSMMKDHLDLTLAEAVDQLQGHFPASVADYDKVHDEILTMSDALSDGIVKQYPDKF